jgi:hypothetical protein
VSSIGLDNECWLGTRVKVRGCYLSSARLDRDWYVAALANQGHAGKDGSPQIDGCEGEYQHCASVARGDVHIVFVQRMLLIGPEVNADIVRPKTFVERNAYLVAVHRFAQLLRRRLIEHDADLARSTLIGDAVGLGSLLELVAMRDDPFRMKVPAHQVLKQLLHVAQ